MRFPRAPLGPRTPRPPRSALPSYAEVQKWAHLEAMYERATIILEMEQSMLPVTTELLRWRFAAAFRYRQVGLAAKNGSRRGAARL